MEKVLDVDDGGEGRCQLIWIVMMEKKLDVDERREEARC